jgi:hypothetical protein
MGSKGDRFDNAVAESFFATLQQPRIGLFVACDCNAATWVVSPFVQYAAGFDRRHCGPMGQTSYVAVDGTIDGR